MRSKVVKSEAGNVDTRLPTCLLKKNKDVDVQRVYEGFIETVVRGITK